MGDRRTGRVLAVLCPDWPATAAAAAEGLPEDAEVAVLAAGRVIACSYTARRNGVRRGLRRREAQSRSPEVHVFRDDPGRDARLFEPLAAAMEEVTAGVEVLRPGLMVFDSRGMRRRFGGEEAAAERLVDIAAAVGVEIRVGAADALTTAVIAARHTTFVPPGDGARFLADLPIDELSGEPSLEDDTRADLIDLLRRLGLRRIGDFAALSPADVASRFGRDAITAHRAARAEPERGVSHRDVPTDIAVEKRCDPPVGRVDAAAFVGRGLAEEVHHRLAASGLACTRLLVHVESSRGDVLSRTWRCGEPLTARATADRIRWQIDGWMTGRARPGGRPGVPGRAGRSGRRAVRAADEEPVDDPGDEIDDADEGVVLLRLEPLEVVDAGYLQSGLWGETGRAGERAQRALTRVQGLLGGDAVRVATVAGGYGPGERITEVPFGDERVPHADPAAPWPGLLPQPTPAIIYREHPDIDVLDRIGAPVLLTERDELSAVPEQVRRRDRRWRLRAWAGPWPVHRRWWATPGRPDADVDGARARIQVVLDDNRALLLLYTDAGWRVEGRYE